MFKNPFSFNGRIARMEYAISFLVYAIAAIFFILRVKREDTEAILAFLCYIPFAWFKLAQGAKRCHDMGKTGWFQIIPFFFIVLISADGDFSYNKYGPDTKKRDYSGEFILPE